MQIRRKILRATQNLSMGAFLFFILGYPIRKSRRLLDARALEKTDSLLERFTLIYRLNAWGSKESVSGSGSTLDMTYSIRSLLPTLFEKFAITSLFDAPCGDFNWMQLLDLKGISYIGGDIVEPLINKLNDEFSSDSKTFVHIDITIDAFPKSDLVLNRDCFFHLSYQDILLTLNNFLESGSKYFLSTSYDNNREFTNSDIRSGGFRLIDLFTDPFNFPRDFHFQIPEQGEGSLPPRSLYLWDRNQVESAISSLSKFLA